MRVAALLFLPLLAVTAVAQHDVLAVERRGDLRAHASAVKLLRKTRIALHAEDMTMKELCSLLSSATAHKLPFSCSKRESEAASHLELEVRSASIWSILSMTQMKTGMRFVVRSGIVFLTTADKIKPLTYLAIYDFRGACTKLRSFPGPDLRLRTASDDRPLFPEEVESESTVSGLTAEGIETLLQESVRPASWAIEGVSLTNQNGLFLIRQTPQVQREIRALFVRLGLVAPGITRPARRATGSSKPRKLVPKSVRRKKAR